MAEFSNVGQIIEAAAGPAWSAHGSPFLLLDGARLPKMRAWLRTQGGGIEWICLFGGDIDSELIEASPVLVQLPDDASDRFLLNVLNAPACRRAASFLVSRYALNELAEHFEQHLYVDDPDGQRWGLAFWDPFILSSLVGSRPTISALVPGPVLTPSQCASLLEPVPIWCFRGRDGNPCAIRSPAITEQPAKPPFALNQAQMNQLADISLPDQMFNVLAEVMSERILASPDFELHRVFCDAVRRCRQQGEDTLGAHCAVASDTLTR